MENKNLNWITLTSIVTIASLLTGCATNTRSTGLGAGIGGGTGALVGSIMSGGKNGEVRTRNVILGTTIGALAGGLTGSLIQSSQEKARMEAYEKGKLDAPRPTQGKVPQVHAPKVESIWVEGRAVGNRFIDGHYEYVITEPTRWEEN